MDFWQCMRDPARFGRLLVRKIRDAGGQDRLVPLEDLHDAVGVFLTEQRGEDGVEAAFGFDRLGEDEVNALFDQRCREPWLAELRRDAGGGAG